MFSKFFIERPIFATVISLIIVLAGLVSMKVLPIEQYPNIVPTEIQISAVYPGATAEVLADTVAAPIEQELNGVKDMIYMYSNATSSGYLTIGVVFDIGTDPDQATIDVNNKVQAATSKLPSEVTKQGVTVEQKSNSILQVVTMRSTSSRYDTVYVSNYALLNVIDEIKRIKGVGSASLFASQDYSMRIWLSPDKLADYNLTPQDVISAIQEQNSQFAAGQFGQEPMDEAVPFTYSVNTKGRLVDEKEFGNIILTSDAQGGMLRLKDVARIELGAQDYSVSSTFNGEPSVAFAVYLQPGANALETANLVKAKMAELSKNFPEGITYEIPYDTTLFVNVSINEVIHTFFEAVLLVIVVVYLFLQNMRATLIPILAVPVSIIGAFAGMYVLGFSINLLTLFGLILAVAIVVDDAIVVVENASRLLETGQYSTREAVTKAMGEITGPIVGVVLVLLAVFIPTMLISGISGQLYKQFALTIAASTVLSGFNSLTLTPALCALFLEKSKPSNFFIYKGFNKAYDKTQGAYDKIVKWLLARPGMALVSYGILTAIAVLLFMHWPSTFIPDEDDGYFIAVVQLPPAASLERTQAVGDKINRILDSYPEVENYIGISGFSVMGGGEQSNSATYFVVLKNWSERKGKEHTAAAVVNRFNGEAYMTIQAGTVFAMVPPAIPGLGASGGLQLQLEDRRNLGPTEMQQAINAMLASYHSKPALASVSSQYQANVPQYFLNIDRDKVQFMGIALNDVFSTLSYYMGAAYVNDFVEFGRIYQVKIEARDQAQRVIDDVLKLSVPNAAGEMVPFSSFTKVEEQLGQDQINRYNMYSTASLTCNVAPGSSTGQAIQEVEALFKEQLGDEFGYEWTSVAYQETQAGNTTTIVLVMALIVAFLVLAAQYESWTSPVAAVIGLPVALLGAMIGCLVMGTPVSIYTQIGIILLVALSAKNGILIVEFARDFHAEGNSIRESAFEAGHVRLRPILMTSFAFVLGVMPLLFASGAGAQSRIALGAAVVFGMAMNTLLATVYIPNFYELMQKLQEKFNKKKGNNDKQEGSM